MQKQQRQTLAYDWERDIAPYLNSLEAVQGGFTLATRGVVTLSDGAKVFVKIATDSATKKWLQKEVTVYTRLNAAGYAYIPELLSVADDHSAMGITYLAGHSFENTWDADKLNAVIAAQQALKKHKNLFADDPEFDYHDGNQNHKWIRLLEPGNIDVLNRKLEKFSIPAKFSQERIRQFSIDQAPWDLRSNTLIHEDIRADNFGYNSGAKSGKLIDWNWLCIGDEGLDTTPLYVNIYQSGLNPYQLHPEKYDAQMLIYLVGFWAYAVLQADEDANPTEWKLRAAQARNAVTCYELLQTEPARRQTAVTAAG